MCPPKSSPSHYKMTGDVPGGRAATSAGSSFRHSLNYGIALTGGTESKNGRPSPARLSGVVKMLATFDPPKAPNVPKLLHYGENSWAGSFSYMPRKRPQRNPCGMGHSGGLGRLGEYQIGKNF